MHLDNADLSGDESFSLQAQPALGQNVNCLFWEQNKVSRGEMLHQCCLSLCCVHRLSPVILKET